MSENSVHALCSPSSGEKWINCPGSLGMEKDFPPQEISKYIREGLAAHTVAALALTDGIGQASIYEGQEYDDFEVTEDICEDVQEYVDFVKEISKGLELHVEQKLSIEHLTGEIGAVGTTDAVIIAPDEIIVVDLKFGRGISVYASNNSQLMLYALAAINEFPGDYKRVRLIIHQPRIGNISEWDCGIEYLYEFAEKVKAQATKALDCYNDITLAEKNLNPGDKQCQWCKAKATCPALRNFVTDAVGAMFDDITEEVVMRPKTFDNNLLADMLDKVPTIRMFCDAVEDKAESELLSGNAVPRRKLIEGKKGHRKWTDKDVVEKALKALKLKQKEMYTFKVISPTQASRLLEKSQPGKWAKICNFITQTAGQPTVVDENDKHPAFIVKPVIDAFDNVTNSVEDLF